MNQPDADTLTREATYRRLLDLSAKHQLWTHIGQAAHESDERTAAEARAMARVVWHEAEALRARVER